jgi:predicted CXXCH cytochrome family protein
MAGGNRDDDRAGREKPAPLSTLYASPLADPRARAAFPREQPRGRAAKKAQKTSDVTRFRGLALATAVAGTTTAAAALLLPPPGGLSVPGPLARPHVAANVACESCHGTSALPKKPAEACAGCHGPHPSMRAGHKRLAEKGALLCTSCHPIHRADQGVAFLPGEQPIRFGPGAETAIEGASPSTLAATVPIVSAASCAGCHDPASPRDPVARCLVPGQDELGPDRPTVCFDEHQSALPPDVPTRPAAFDGGKRACAAQHFEGRPAAWDAARDAASLMPAPPRPDFGSLSLLWLALGLVAGGATFGAARGVERVREKKRARKGTATEGLLEPQTRVRLPQIDTTTCLGCFACVDVCPYDVLEIERYVAVVVRPEACCGLTLCEQRCPNGSLRITDGATIGDRPRISDTLESTDTPGLFLAGDVTGLPLIKNAILQGSFAVDQIDKGLHKEGAWSGEGPRPLDLLIVGAGPAGISAALRAKELDLAFEVVEQGDVAQSIKSFPRGKLVFDQPLDLPLTGKLWLKESTKEELLSHWMRIVRKEALPIRQDTRMASITRDASGGFFRVVTEPREGGPPTERRARRVLVAIGQRGTPRRLPFALASEIETRVHYHLADARSFEGKRVIVVGLGDVAMEAAVALARQPGTTVTVVHRSAGFSRGKARNIEETKRMRDAGRLRLVFEAEVTAIDLEGATLKKPSGKERVPCDAVFVMIGSIPPWSTLQAVGVGRVGEQSEGEDPSASIFVQGPTGSP